jgi:hypothetical protein
MHHSQGASGRVDPAGPDYGPGAHGSRAARQAVLTKPGPRAGSASAGAA